MLPDIVKCWQIKVNSMTDARPPTEYLFTYFQLFRISAHGILIAITCAISFLISKQHEGNNTIQGVVFCMLISLFMVTYFISFHADLAEGILVSVFVEEKLLGDEDFALKSL